MPRPRRNCVWNGVGAQPWVYGPVPQLGPNPANSALPYAVTISPVTAGLLAIVPLPNFEVGQGIQANGQALGDIFTYPHSQPTTEHYGQIRVDHTFSSADSFFVRYTIDNTVRITPGNFLGIVNPSGGRSQF